MILSHTFLFTLAALRVASSEKLQDPLPPAPILPPDPFPTIVVPSPKYLDFIMHNMNVESPDFSTLRMSTCMLDVDTVHLRVAKHVEDKLYKITSITATEHAYVVVCDTRLSYAQLDQGTEGGSFPGMW